MSTIIYDLDTITGGTDMEYINSSIDPTDSIDPTKESNELVFQILLGILLSSISVAGFCGNFLVVVAVIRTRTLNSVTDYFICSLACADLFVSVFIMPFAIATEILKGVWLFGVIFCSIWSSFDILCCTASIMNLCAISIDRYIAIIKPLTYREIVTPLRCWIAIAVVWILASSLAFSQLLWKSLVTEDAPPDVCIYTPDKSFRIYSTLTSFFIPMFITVVIYCRIIPVAFKQARKINNVQRSPSLGSTHSMSVNVHLSVQGSPDKNLERKQFRKAASVSSLIKQTLSPLRERSETYTSSGMKGKKPRIIENFALRRNESELTDSSSSIQAIGQPGNRGRGPITVSRKSRYKEWKVIKTLVMVVGVFFVCWLPFAITIAIEPFVPPLSPPMMSVFLWLGYFNSVSNPIIYVWLNRSYRRAFKKVLFGRRLRHDQES